MFVFLNRLVGVEEHLVTFLHFLVDEWEIPVINHLQDVVFALFDLGDELFAIAIEFGVMGKLPFVQSLLDKVWVELNVEVIIDVFEIAFIVDGRSGDVLNMAMTFIHFFLKRRKIAGSLVIQRRPSLSTTALMREAKAQYSSVSSTRKAGDHSRCKCPSCLYACTWRQFLKRLSVIIREAQR